MSDEPSNAERTAAPTPLRRQQARDEGRIARSPEVSAAVVLLTGTMALAFAGVSLTTFTFGLLRESAAALSGGALSLTGATAMLRGVTLGFGTALLPLLLALVALVTFANLVQTRGAVSTQPLQPRWSRVSPVAGLKRLFGSEAVFQLVKQCAKLAALGVLTWFVLSKSWPDLLGLPGAPAGVVAIVLRSISVRLAITIGLAFLALSLGDYAFQWLKLEKSLRMSRQDLMREHRESEGDPLIKGRIRSIARARARRRMLQQVAEADVVVVNPTEIAVALRYDPAEAAAPVVVAMGERKLAERIRAVARRADVPIVENRPAARALLATAVVGRPIPPALYAAVAEILAFVFRQRGVLPGSLAAASHRSDR